MIISSGGGERAKWGEHTLAWKAEDPFAHVQEEVYECTKRAPMPRKWTLKTSISTIIQSINIQFVLTIHVIQIDVGDFSPKTGGMLEGSDCDRHTCSVGGED